MQTATQNVSPMTDAEQGARERVERNARARGCNVAATLRQQARDRAKRSRRLAEVNDVICETDIRSAAWEISEVCYQSDRPTIDEIVARHDTPSADYKSAVAGFLAQAEQVGAVVLTGRDIFVADYDLLLSVLGPFIQRW